MARPRAKRPSDKLVLTIAWPRLRSPANPKNDRSRSQMLKPSRPCLSPNSGVVARGRLSRSNGAAGNYVDRLPSGVDVTQEHREEALGFGDVQVETVELDCVWRSADDAVAAIGGTPFGPLLVAAPSDRPKSVLTVLRQELGGTEPQRKN